jgi:ferredoxin-NADP reductase
MRLAEQTFSYVHNLAFRGPRALLVEWDPAQNPERRNPAVRNAQQEIRLGAPLAKNSVRNLQVQAITNVAKDIRLLRLASSAGSALPHWSAGAHIDIECGDTGLSRQYSLCGNPDDRAAWEVAILRDPQSRGGSHWLHSQLSVGDTVRVRGPRNHFRLDENHTGRLIFIAGGIGITPIMAMARQACALGRDYVVHYSCSTPESMAFTDLLGQEHGTRLKLYVSSQGVRNDFNALACSLSASDHIYACGPSRMLDGLQAAVSAAGLPEDVLHVEHFSNEQPRLDPTREIAFEVELKNSGLVLTVPNDRTLLEVLRAKNIDVQSDCEEGLCGACEVGVLAGDIDHRDSIMSPSEKRENRRMMTCCSRARAGGKLVLDL